jgi:hypothetical protein
MSNERCVRCGDPARGFAALNGHRLCHSGPSPTCYEAACAAFNGHNWDQLVEHWARVQSQTQIEIEHLRRWDAATRTLVPAPARFLAAIEDILESAQ